MMIGSLVTSILTLYLSLYCLIKTYKFTKRCGKDENNGKWNGS